MDGVPPQGRSIQVVLKVMEWLGRDNYVFAGGDTDPMVSRLHAIHSGLYRPSDFAIGGLHGGIFMFRDIFARVYIPISYGRVAIKPLEMTNLSPSQLKWLAGRSFDLQMYLDQFGDIFDFAGGVSDLADFKTPPKEAREMFTLAAFQLQAAAATLSVAFDLRGAVQSSIMGAELALKGGLAAVGYDEAARIKFRHDLPSAAKALREKMPKFDLERVLATLLRMPKYVENRYSSAQPNRVEIGHIAMGAQFIAGEVMRQVTGHRFNSALSMRGQRVYPPLPGL